MKYQQILELAIEIIDYLNENDLNFENSDQLFCNLKDKFLTLKNFDLAKAKEILDSFSNLNSIQTINISFAIILFYILSNCHYPQAFWQDVILKKEKTKPSLFKMFLKSVKLSDYEQKEIVNTFIKKLKTSETELLVNKYTTNFGKIHLMEMLWIVLVEKYPNFQLNLWRKNLKNYIFKKNEKRTGSCKSINKFCNSYHLSLKGSLEKPGKFACEDFSKITRFNKENFLVSCCDGIGSCKNSFLGSCFASLSLEKVIMKNLKRYQLLESDQSVFQFIDHLYNHLSDELYQEFFSKIKKYNKKIKNTTFSIDDFGTTLQFCLSLKNFLICGCVGDGNFIIRKKIKDQYAYFNLNDGRSSILTPKVFSVSSLKNTPQALQLFLFKKDEISDLLITSDGFSKFLPADCLTDRFLLADQIFFTKLRNLNSENCFKQIYKYATLAVDSNDQLGSGDDATLIYIKFDR